MIGGVPLPDWSERDGTPDIPYTAFADAAVTLHLLGGPDRRAEVDRYSQAHCLPRFSISEASGLYVLLRILFDLPTRHPLDATKVFGGWLHPSIGRDPFDLSWPVALDGEKAVVQPFTGYRGKGYDAIGEYDWFAERFAIRPADRLRSLAVARG